METSWLIPALTFLFSSAILIKCGSLAVKFVSQLAKQIHLSEFMASFVLAGFISILPEFFVALNSAIEHVPEVGIGTLIGNNIVDLTLVIGIVLILGRELPVPHKNRMPTIPFIIAVSFPLAFMYDGVISFFDGVILVLGSVVYFGWMISRDGIFEKRVPFDFKKALPPMACFAAVMLGMYFTSKYVVESAVEISHIFGVPELFAGLFLISLGAALPELTFSAQAVLARHKSVALGDVLGNVVLDSTFSIGVMAMITPIPIFIPTIGLSALLMAFAALLVSTFIDHNGKLTRRDGIALVGLFIVFLVVQLTIQGILYPVPAH